MNKGKIIPITYLLLSTMEVTRLLPFFRNFIKKRLKLKFKNVNPKYLNIFIKIVNSSASKNYQVSA